MKTETTFILRLICVLYGDKGRYGAFGFVSVIRPLTIDVDYLQQLIC